MNIQSKPPATPDEFLRWNEGREGKREFVQARVVEMMINVTRNNVRLATCPVIALASRLDEAAYDVGSADFAVRTPDGIRYPAVFVDGRTPQTSGSDLAATAPVLLAEVLSASSRNRDFSEKLADYVGLPSLQHYLILSADEPRAWLWSRDGTGEWGGPEEFASREQRVELDALGVSIPLRELYSGIAGPGASLP